MNYFNLRFNNPQNPVDPQICIFCVCYITIVFFFMLLHFMVLVFKIDKLFENLYRYYIVTKIQKA